MIIKKGTPHLFLRVADYKNYNFIDEHQKVLKEEKYVWILKLGRIIDTAFTQKVIDNNGAIIIKSLVKYGNKFYYCKLESNKIPTKDDKNKYPKYYNELLCNEGYVLEDLLESGRWFKISEMNEISSDLIYKFSFIKTNNPVTEKSILSRTVHMYLVNDKDIVI